MAPRSGPLPPRETAANAVRRGMRLPAAWRALAGLVVVLVCGLAPGCASDDPVGRPPVQRMENPVPEGLQELRDQLAERREEQRAAYEEGLYRPSDTNGAAPDGSTPFLDTLGRIGGTALDVLSLRTFGLW